ncbi:hypothetical protein E1B28_010880 [Marasmius oreades]|uniref:Transcobalamin-like C-terminal domain-containing protein n=1 Tax=Marasmius oreades TaxID=181124 RepID=A0A9P7UPE3_9AGAR|nr:uncharacterized protein E1B28_010880 [Marasmius oreades]KAG7089178.1 hypothetical protein E1B28_010880 [Marasmius oreades]
MMATQPKTTFAQQSVWGAGFQDFSGSDSPVVFVKLRIEGANKTIFEGCVPTFGHSITTASGGKHHCDGTNNHTPVKLGPTCTTALNDASKIHRFDFDATFSPDYDDYFITSIGGDKGTTTQAWSLILNYQQTTKGGCQTKVSKGDEILWAFDAYHKTHFLKLEAPSIVKAGTTILLTVTDGKNKDVCVQGATVTRSDGSTGTVVGTSDKNGTVSVHFPDSGVFSFKASKDDSIRSNSAIIFVTDA